MLVFVVPLARTIGTINYYTTSGEYLFGYTGLDFCIREEVFLLSNSSTSCTYLWQCTCSCINKCTCACNSVLTLL